MNTELPTEGNKGNEELKTPLPSLPSVQEPIQPPYRTRGGEPVCPDCNRVRCICQYRQYED
jgi:hypothetical protein